MVIRSFPPARAVRAPRLWLARAGQAAAWLGWAAMWLTAELFYLIGDGFQWAARQFRAASSFCRRRVRP